MELVAGTIIGGKYRLERPLARGGMGALWVATHLGLNAQLVVKLLDPQFAQAENYRVRFEREARASAALRSPHIVHVHDYGIQEEIPFIAMELLLGEDLGHRLRRVRRFTVPDTWGILVQVGKGLRRAHEAGIVHRDLKPANLFLARVDDDEVVKILDFGIAKETNPIGESTKAGEMVGSPHYMSPEQVRCERDIDSRADLWSLAVILFRMLTGVLPFPGAQFGPVIAKVLMEAIPIPSQVAPDLPPAVDAFFVRALARERADRFATVSELVDAFGLVVASVSPGGVAPRVLPVSGVHPALASNPDPASFGPASGTPTTEASMMVPLTSLSPGADDPRLSSPMIDADAEIAVPPGATWRRSRAAWWGAAAAVLVLTAGLVALVAGRPGSPETEAASQPVAAATSAPPVIPPSPASVPAPTGVATATAPPSGDTAPSPAPSTSASVKVAAPVKTPAAGTARPIGKRKWF